MGAGRSETYRVTVTAAGPGPPAVIRLRRAGLRAVKVEELAGEQTAGDQGESGEGNSEGPPDG